MHDHPTLACHHSVSLLAMASPTPPVMACRESRKRSSKQATHGDEDMTPSDTTIDYKVCSFLYLHSDFRYNSLGSTCTCRYLNVGANMSQSASLLKLNFRFVGSLTVFHCEDHSSSIRSAIEVNKHLIKRLFDKLSNRSSPTSISHWQGLQII
jgi:hypothetical protein